MELDDDFDEYQGGGYNEEEYEEEYDGYDGSEDRDDWGGDGGCGEGFSCDECPNAGCPAHPLN